jgi:hypothetical protein
MPLFSPISSNEFIATEAASPAVIDKLATLSEDEPLPADYQLDRIRLLAQSPRKLFLYWEHSSDPFETLKRAFGHEAESYTLLIRLVSLEDETESFHEASASRSQWLDVLPDRSYRVDVGLYAPGRSFIRLLFSNLVRTPRAGVAREADQSPEWSIPSEQFSRVLDDAGYPNDALEITLEAADQMTGNGSTAAIARTLAGVELPAMGDETVAELRGLLSALAFGVSSEQLRALLSPPLVAWIDQFDARSNASRDATTRLVEILRSTLGVEMSRAPSDAPREADLRRAARVIVGASLVNLPEQPFHLWLPSMNARRSS